MNVQGATVVIDCFAASVERYRDDHAVVAVDVIRATTLAITSIATGRRCLIASDLEDAFALRDSLGGALLAGELGGNMPFGFEMNNSPADLVERVDIERPLVMLSTSGTDTMRSAAGSGQAGYAACFRNLTATARFLVGRHRRVALIGAGSRGEFREEDQMGCAWLADLLFAAGYGPEDAETQRFVERWRGAPVTAFENSNSVAYLRETDQLRDVAFITGHVDDLDLVCVIDGNELRAIIPSDQPGAGAEAPPL